MKYATTNKTTFNTYIANFKYIVDGNSIIIEEYIGEDTYVDIPNYIDNKTVNKIDKRAFAGTSVERVKIPSTVNIIDGMAFMDCNKLEKVIMYDGISDIEICAFNGCDSLKEIIIPKTVKSIGTLAFSDCASLNNIFIENGVQEIGESAFSFCLKIKNIEIPSSVKIIKDGAFSVCSSLENVVINNGVKIIGKETFSYLNNATITIPESVTLIEKDSFRSCENLMLCVFENSYAHNYAKENKIKYRLL